MVVVGAMGTGTVGYGAITVVVGRAIAAALVICAAVGITDVLYQISASSAAHLAKSLCQSASSFSLMSLSSPRLNGCE